MESGREAVIPLQEIDLCKIVKCDKQERINNLQSKIDKASDLLQLLHYRFNDEDSIHNEIEDIQKVLKEEK